MMINEPYIPELDGLYNLYQYILINKRTTILEFGSGWSTLIFSLALNELSNKFSNEVKQLRRNNPFELFVIENEKKYMDITKNRILKFNKYLKIKKPIKIKYFLSDVEMIKFENKICTQYSKLPVCNPDFVYLDGPDQFNVKKDINGISTRHKDMMPMVWRMTEPLPEHMMGWYRLGRGRVSNRDARIALTTPTACGPARGRAGRRAAAPPRPRVVVKVIFTPPRIYHMERHFGFMHRAAWDGR